MKRFLILTVLLFGITCISNAQTQLETLRGKCQESIFQEETKKVNQIMIDNLLSENSTAKGDKYTVEKIIVTINNVTEDSSNVYLVKGTYSSTIRVRYAPVSNFQPEDNVITMIKEFSAVAKFILGDFIIQEMITSNLQKPK